MSRFNREAYRLAMHSLTHQKKNIIIALIALLPSLAAALAMTGDAVRLQEVGSFDHGLVDMADALLFAVSIPLLCLFMAGGMIADEAQERTLSYLLVRPVPRHTLFLSRMVAVWTFALPLALFQAMSLWIVRFIAFSRYSSPNAVTPYGDDLTVPIADHFWHLLPALLIASLLAALFYSTLFGLVSLASTRYHFFITISYVAIWEGIAGHIPANVQRMTATHYLRSIMDVADVTAPHMLPIVPTAQWLSIVVLVAASAGAALASLVVVRRRDFHVTSAST